MLQAWSHQNMKTTLKFCVSVYVVVVMITVTVNSEYLKLRYCALVFAEIFVGG